MLDFFSGESLKAVILLLIAASLLYASISSHTRGKKRERLKRYFLLFALLLLTLPFIEAYIAQSDVKSNQTSFTNGASFICKESKDKSYSVSKKELWSIKEIYFSKDSLLIRADRCKLR